MEPFNIKIGYGQNTITLTILPTNEGYHKVLYFGGILGAVREDPDGWELIPFEEIIAGNLPLYQPDLNAERIEVILNDYTVDKIGEEIDMYYHDDSL